MPRNAVKDSFATLTFQRNYRSFFANGKEVFSSTAGGNKCVRPRILILAQARGCLLSLPSMITEYFCPEILDGSNRISCGGCKV